MTKASFALLPKSRAWRTVVFSGLGILILLALARLVLHTLTNAQYGWHRDELDTLTSVDNARYLAWGYVSYPPVTPFIARVGLVLFGPSLVGLRFFSALAVSSLMVLAGLTTHELGGLRLAQITAALAAAIAPISLLAGALVTYSSFDYVWWVLVAYLMIRLLKSDDPRRWLGIGAVIGLGMLTKYTMSFMVASIVAGVLLTRARRYLTSPWLWVAGPYFYLIAKAGQRFRLPLYITGHSLGGALATIATQRLEHRIKGQIAVCPWCDCGT